MISTNHVVGYFNEIRFVNIEYDSHNSAASGMRTSEGLFSVDEHIKHGSNSSSASNFRRAQSSSTLIWHEKQMALQFHTERVRQTFVGRAMLQPTVPFGDKSESETTTKLSTPRDERVIKGLAFKSMRLGMAGLAVLDSPHVCQL